MSQVATVRGPVEVADLGPTYMHEHIFVLTADVQQNYPGEWSGEDLRQRAMVLPAPRPCA
jgi:phosphotriesterase-related protein